MLPRAPSESPAPPTSAQRHRLVEDVPEPSANYSEIDALGSTAYESVRRDPAQFVVAPGHELPEIEVVVLRTKDYQVVRKQGEAAEVATEEDPRRSL